MSLLKDYHSFLNNGDKISEKIQKFWENFDKLIKDKEIKNIAILTHNLADLDGFASAIALKDLLDNILKDKKIQVKIFIPSLSNPIKSVISTLDIQEVNNISKELDMKPDLVFLVDCNNINNIDPEYVSQLQGINIVVIDHHEANNDFSDDYVLHYVDSYSSSNAELMVDFYSFLKIPISKHVGQILLVGIIADTGQFKFANSDTYIRVSALENAEILFKDALSLFQARVFEYSERIARLKAGMRITDLLVLDNFIASISNVSSHQASAARGLIELGSDLSFIIAKEKPKKKLSFFISGRASSSVIKALNFSTASFLNELFKKFNGDGGGHAGAAAGKGVVDEEKLKKWLIEKEKKDANYQWLEKDVINYIKFELISELNKIGEWRKHA